MRAGGREGLVRPKSLRDLAVDYLRSAIIDADFELGALLSENTLSEQLRISKTPIHEALVILQSQGLVEILPQRGARVFDPTPDQLLDLCDYRLLIEIRAVNLAHERNRKRLLAALDRVLTQMIAAWKDGRVKDYLRLDTDFHNLFFEHSGSPCLQAASAQVAARIAAVRTHIAGRNQSSRQTAFDEHVQIVDFLKQDRVSEVAAILHDHVHRLLDLFVAQHELIEN
jgi:DNA-binding GntR family transcriptional regulator